MPALATSMLFERLEPRDVRAVRDHLSPEERGPLDQDVYVQGREAR